MDEEADKKKSEIEKAHGYPTGTNVPLIERFFEALDAMQEKYFNKKEMYGECDSGSKSA